MTTAYRHPRYINLFQHRIDCLIFFLPFLPPWYIYSSSTRSRAATTYCAHAHPNIVAIGFDAGPGNPGLPGANCSFLFCERLFPCLCAFIFVVYLAGERAFDFSDFLLHFLCLFSSLLSIVSVVYLVLGFLGRVGLDHLSHLGNGSAPKI